MVCQSLSGQNIWPLNKCIEEAWKNNLAIKTTEVNLKSADINKKEAKHARYPDLNIGSSVNWNFGRTIDPTSNEFSTSTFFRNGLNLGTNVVLFNGFAIKNQIKKSEIDIKAGKSDIAQLRNDIALNVATFYLNALFAKENTTIAQANLALSQKTLNQIQVLVRSGARAANEVLDIEAQLATDEQNLLTAQNNYDIAKLQLKQLMLVEEDIDVVMPDNIALNTNPDLVEIEELYESALKNQPSVAAAEWRVKGSDISIDIAKGQRYPSISFGGNLGSNYSNLGQEITGFETIKIKQEVDVTLPNFPTQSATLEFPQEFAVTRKADYFYQFDKNLSYGVGFGINIPILTNYRTSANIERAKLEGESARLNLETVKQDIKIKVQQAYADAKAAKSKLSAAEKTMEAQEAAYNNTLKRFELGAINSFDLSNARTRFDNAKINLLIAKYDHIFKTKILDFYLGKGI